MTAMEEARPLYKSVSISFEKLEATTTNVVIMSWNSHIPRSDAATPRTADEIM